MKKVDVISYAILILLGSTLIFFDSGNYKEGIHVVLIYCGSFIAFALLKEIVVKVLFRKKDIKIEQYPLPVTDERIEKMSLKFMAQVFGLSHLIGSAILFVLFLINRNMMIPVSYALYYLFGILFFTMMFGLKIVKRLDN